MGAPTECVGTQSRFSIVRGLARAWSEERFKPVAGRTRGSDRREVLYYYYEKKKTHARASRVRRVPGYRKVRSNLVCIDII
jgi:hypothetical protein